MEVQEVRGTQKTEQAGYRQKDIVEQERYGEVHSASGGERPSQDGVLNLYEVILSKENLIQAHHQVVGNQGAAGVDGMSCDELLPYLKENQRELLTQLYTGSYCSMPVRRVEIRKDEGGMRKLGIPTVIDRMIQQATNQVLQQIFDPEFSDNSFGFRPRRSAHMAIMQTKAYYEQGYEYVVDIDLKAYFDTINHDKLMYLIEKKVKDKRVLWLIRRYLQSGIMEDGLVKPTEEGATQGN